MKKVTEKAYVKNEINKEVDMKFKSLKVRINMMTVIYSIIIISISSWVMFSIVSNLISQRMEEENTAFVNQIRNTIDNDLTELNNIALLFTPYGNLGASLVEFKKIENIGEKSIMMSKIKADMGVISYSNPDVLLCAFFLNDENIDFIGTVSSIEEINFEKLPVMYSNHQNIFYGPHSTSKVVDETPVISLTRTINIGSETNTYIYVETTFEDIRMLLEERRQLGYDYLLVNSQGDIIYTTQSEAGLYNSYTEFQKNDNLIFHEADSENGWKMISIVDSLTIREMERSLVLQNIMVYPNFLLSALIFSYVLIKIIARPLQRFQEGVIQLEEGDFNTLIPKTNIHEFDILIDRMHKAKLMISLLMDEIKEKEKKHAFAEISRLRAQINPHFILNTLNSVHWMAMRNKQMDIDGVIMSLTKILSYNLRNKQYTATIGDELAATQEYIKLQQLKYEIQYEFESLLGDDGLEQEMPRFILQPLVENSILHGKEAIKILLKARYVDEGIELSLRDFGGKIPETTLQYINEHKKQPEKLGIGLSYVYSALEAYYHRDDLVFFEDVKTGVLVTIILPMKGEASDV